MTTAAEIKYAKVAVDLPLLPGIKDKDVYYYSIPEEIKDEIKSGTIVHIPFGKQELNGFVIEVLTSKISDFIKKGVNLKPLYDIIYKNQIWDEKYLELARWISKYYFTNIGTVLSLSVNADMLDHYSHEIKLVEDKDLPDDLNNDQLFIINKLLQSKNKHLSYRFLMQKSRFSKSRFYQLINQLQNKNIIKKQIKKTSHKKTKKVKEISIKLKSDPIKNIIMNKDQENAFNHILNSISQSQYNTFLLHGVTGSGKTEIYLNLITEVLKRNKTVIYLVPEIYLVPQIYERLSKRFKPEEIIVWHSSLGKAERSTYWDKLQRNEVKIILGARSAILAPIKNLGLIVVDEAHESSYKQASPAPRYNAIKVAQKRGEIENCPVILGTATPNIDEYFECAARKTILNLPKRIQNIPMPKVYIVDLREEYPKSEKNIISNVLKSGITEALKNKEQIILLLNRRGYSSIAFCKACGYIQYCKNCSVPLVYHKNRGSMTCHHCGFEKTVNLHSLVCPECKSPHFKFTGLGTQQLEEEIKKTFQNAKTIRVDSDQLQRKDEYLKSWEEFSSGKADILIGTQIVAKGIDLPNVTVVGVISADSMLNFPDYVSVEKAFQLLTQVSGRAGRGDKPGNVFIQTYQSENPVFEYIKEHNFEAFYKSEIKHREDFKYPPFKIIIRLVFQSYSEKDCIEHADYTLDLLSKIAKGELIPEEDCTFLGPAPCFFTKLHGKYRHHILCKISNEDIKNQIFNEYFELSSKNDKVEVIIDIDSINLL